jgi:hypothetical protein
MKRMYRAGTLNRENLIDQAPGMWGRAYNSHKKVTIIICLKKEENIIPAF